MSDETAKVDVEEEEPPVFSAWCSGQPEEPEVSADARRMATVIVARFAAGVVIALGAGVLTYVVLGVVQ